LKTLSGSLFIFSVLYNYISPIFKMYATIVSTFLLELKHWGSFTTKHNFLYYLWNNEINIALNFHFMVRSALHRRRTCFKLASWQRVEVPCHALPTLPEPFPLMLSYLSSIRGEDFQLLLLPLLLLILLVQV